MDAPHGRATFPGIDHLLSASISLGPGISPGSARLVIAPQPNLDVEEGTLTFQLGSDTVSFPACKLDRSSLARGEGGEVWNLSLLDRRWKWRFGAISGQYNVRRDNGTLRAGGGELVADTERTPQQLAALYLDAMHEVDYDVSRLPNDARPAVDHDHDNPARALADLCDSLGCRVVLGLDNRVRIVANGEGGALPPDFLLEDSAAVNLPELPRRIAVVCGPTFYQVDFPLEAVGLDAPAGAGDAPGETIQPIDALSYRPPGGWPTADLPYFYNVRTASDGSDVTALRVLAAKSVFRYYRIMTPVRIPGYQGADGGLVRRLEQLLPLFEEQVRWAVENGDQVPLPATVFGVWYAGLDEFSNTLSVLVPQGDAPAAAGPDAVTKSPFYQRGFMIDAARGLVIFDEPVFRNATPNAPKITLAPAQLVLRAKCQVRDAVTLATERHVRARTVGALDTPTHYLRHEELVLTHVPAYDPASYGDFPAAGADLRAVTSLTSNLDEVNRQCDAWLDAALAEYHQPQPREVRVAGIRPIEFDGAISQVSYQVGPAGATTSVTRNCETSAFAPGYRERRAADAAATADEVTRHARSAGGSRRVRRDAAARRPAR